MKRSPDNQINAAIIDISRIKWQALKQWPIYIEQTAFQREIKDLVTMDTNCLYKFLAGTSKAQVWDKGIRQKSIKRVNSFIACSAFCPGPPNRDPQDSAMMARQAWRVNKSCGKTHKNRNACIDAHRLAVPTKICGFIRHPMRTG